MEIMMTMRMMFLIAAVSLVLTKVTIAEDFFVEDKALLPIPKSADSAIRQAEAKLKNQIKCKLVGKKVDLAGDGKNDDLLVTTKGTCLWSAGAAPIWGLRQNNGKFVPVLKMHSYSISLAKTTTHGLRNITLTRGSAGYAEVEKWSYDGRSYRNGETIYFDSSDTETCKAHPDICPFDIQ
jgi:hypothetical protein